VNTETATAGDVRAYLRPLRVWWWLILVVVFAVTAGTYLYYDHKPKVYRASTELFVESSGLDKFLTGYPGSVDTQAVDNFAALLQTTPVANQAAKLLGGHLQGSISAQPAGDTDFIIVTGSASSPVQAARVANAFVTAFIRLETGEVKGQARHALATARRQLNQLGEGVDTAAQRDKMQERIQSLQLIASLPGAAGGTGLRQVENATPPARPAAPQPSRNAIFAFVISLALAIGAAFGLEYLNRKISSVEDAEEVFRQPVLAEIPETKASGHSDANASGIVTELYEPFRRLQTNLELLSNERPIRTLLVASAAPAEGKSIIAANLALAYRAAGRRVAVLDTDFRKASLTALLEAQPGPGLSDVLVGSTNVEQAVQEVVVSNGDGPSGNGAHSGEFALTGAGVMASGSLSLLAVGQQPLAISSGLATQRMSQTLSTVTTLFDMVIIDSPPVLAVSDALPLLSAVDGVLLVTRVGVSTRDSARRLFTELEHLPNIQLAGMVVNGVPSRTFRSRAYGYYHQR
jgi:Mrp family chromosome partitioning ATPase/capsular polysaccharide biosynthesis protein